MRTLKFLTPFVAALALAALAVAVYGAFVKQPPSYAGSLAGLRKADTRLSAQLGAADQQIAALKSSSQVGTVSQLQHKVTGLSNRLADYNVCIPEIQQEINGMNVNTSDQNGFLTNAFLQNPTIISQPCQKLLNGPTGP